MGLRDYLMNLKAIEESTGGFAESMEAMRKEAEVEELKRKQQEFYQQLPGMIASGDIGGAAGAAGTAGLPEYGQLAYSSILKQQLDAMKPDKETGYTKEAMAALGLTPEEQKAVESMPKSEQHEYAGRLFQKRSAERAEEKQRLNDEEAARRKRSYSSAQFEKTFTDSRKKLMEEEKKLAGIEKVSTFESLAANRPLLNFVARSIGDEKGPLSDSDIAGFIPRTFMGDVQKFKNYIMSEPEETWTPEVKDAMVKLIGVARENFEKYKDRTMGYLLADSLSNPDLLDKEGMPNERVKKIAKEFSFKYNKDSSSFEKMSIAETLTGAKAKIAQEVLNSSLPEKAKNDILKKIKDKDENKVTEEWMNIVRSKFPKQGK